MDEDSQDTITSSGLGQGPEEEEEEEQGPPVHGSFVSMARDEVSTDLVSIVFFTLHALSSIGRGM